jgi:drug/metabolite transporter (DMT)-like permease
MLSKKFICEVEIALASVCFGLSFVGQRYAATEDMADPVTYNTWRFTVSCIFISMMRRKLQVIAKSDMTDFIPDDFEIMKKMKTISSNVLSIDGRTFDLYCYGILAGLLNFMIQTFQQFGVKTVSAGKAAFINGMFVVVTPFIECMITNNSITAAAWCAVFLCTIGTYLISNVESDFSYGSGELLLLMSMLCCAFSILVSDIAAKRADCIDLTLLELGTVVLLSALISFVYDTEMWYWPLPALQVWLN